MDSQQLAASWVQRLSERGVTVEIRKNRLWLHPSHAHSHLSDDELLTLRHHREAIKEFVRSGGTPRHDPPRIADREIPPPGPRAENLAQIFCAYCHRAECASEPETRRLFHWNDPLEVAKRNEFAAAQMTVMLRRRRGTD